MEQDAPPRALSGSVNPDAEANSPGSGMEGSDCIDMINDVPPDSTYIMTKDHAAAFKKVMEKRRIIWCDYAAAFQAALECVNTKQSQDFATKYIPRALPLFCGEGDAPATPYGHGPSVPGSAWDDWCGEYRRKGNHPAEDQSKYFQTALTCAVKLVLASLDRGSAELIDALDCVLDLTSPIFSFERDVNKASHRIALELHAECMRLWKEGGGPQKRVQLLEKAPWKSLSSVVKSIDSSGESGLPAEEILDRIAKRIEDAPAKESSSAGQVCIDLIPLFKKTSAIHGTGLATVIQNSEIRKKYKYRFKEALKQLALKGTKSGVWAQRRSALVSLESVIRNDKEFKSSNGQPVCSWLEEHEVLEDLFGERAHATIVSETCSLLSIIDMNEDRMNIVVDAAFMHVGSVRAEVHKVILAMLPKWGKKQTMIVLNRIMDVFDVPAVLKQTDGDVKIDTVTNQPPSTFSALGSLKRGGSDCLQAAFELATAIFDTSKLHGLYATVDVMMKGRAVAKRAMDVLVAALLTPFCEDQEVFSKLVQDSLFHCLQSSWGESDGVGANGQGKFCKGYVAELCCNIVKDPNTSPLAMKGAFAVLVEVIRLFPRFNFAQRGDKTREACIHGLQSMFDVIGACMANLKTLSQGLDVKVMQSDDVLNTELWTRLSQLRYLLENTSAEHQDYNIMLEVRQVDQLWEALGGPTEVCLRWIRLAADSGGIFCKDVQLYLFQTYICKMDPSSLKPHGFNSFQALFADVNDACTRWETVGRSGQKSGCKINGPAFVGRRVRVLWKDEKMHNGTICHYSPPSSNRDRAQRHTVRWDDTGKEDTHDWTDLHDWHLLEDELSVNILAYEIVCITDENLEGLEFLWDVCFLSSDDVVAKKAHDMIVDISRYMPHSFQKIVLAKIIHMLQQAVNAMDIDSTYRELRVKRCLQLIRNFLRGHLRICDNVFSYIQYATQRSHGYRGKGKPISICFHVRSNREEMYKSSVTYSSRSIQVGSRENFDEIIFKVINSKISPNSPQVLVIHNGQSVVRGPQTTFEELNITDGADLKIENQVYCLPEILFGNIGVTLAENISFFNLLFEIMEDAHLQKLHMLLWEVLQILPSQREEEQKVIKYKGHWGEVLSAHGNMWKSLYILQIIESELEDSVWCSEFLNAGGFGALVDLMDTVLKLQKAQDPGENQAKMLRMIGIPIILRVLRLCCSGKSVLSNGSVQTILNRVTSLTCDMIILIHRLEMTQKIVDALLDGATILEALIFSSSLQKSEAKDHLKFFEPKSSAELSYLALTDSGLQEGSKMSSNAGIIVNKIVLHHCESSIRTAYSSFLLSSAKTSKEWASQLVDLMNECVNAANRESGTCKQFFTLLTKFFIAQDTLHDPMKKMQTACLLATNMLLVADRLTICNQMMYELMNLLHTVMQRPEMTTSLELKGLAEKLVPKLYNDFLMRVPCSKRVGNAMRMMTRKAALGQNSWLQVAPLCETTETREAAWQLLLICVTRFAPNYITGLADMINEFASSTRIPVKIYWNRLNSVLKEDWEHRATVERRKLACVGLKNQGATCYMNAMIQQLFLDDSLRKCILTAPLAPAPPEKAEELWKCQICTLENDWNCRICVICEQGERPEKVDPVPHGELLRQLQRTFRFMVDSELQSFDPIQLVEACRDLGLHFRVTSQNDSSEFLDKLLERLEREVGGKDHSECLKSCFRVRVCSQLVSVECPHTKPINPGVFEKSFKVNVERMGTLERAIEDALAGELMTGDSRVDCEKCTIAAQTEAFQNGTTHDSAIKRAMRRTLFLDGENMPETLCVQLNRFQFQGNGFVKLNDRLAFPLTLDLAPYTQPPKAQDAEVDDDICMDTTSEVDENKVDENSSKSTRSGEHLLYELKGIVVHSGQFSFGHYYSFAKDPISGKWLKLDDDQVSEFDLAELESECFGGIQTTVNKWTNCVYKTEKSASAYMLFYQRIEGSQLETPVKDKSSSETMNDMGVATPDSVSDAGMEDLNLDSISSSGSETTLAGIDEILDTNEQMLRRSLFFDDEFNSFVLNFILALEKTNKIIPKILEMAINVFYKSVLHSELHNRMSLSRCQPGQQDWSTTLKRLLQKHVEACTYLIRASIEKDEGPDKLPCWLESACISCPIDDVRLSYCQLLSTAISVLIADKKNFGMIEELLASIKDILPMIAHNWPVLPQFGTVLLTLTSENQDMIDLMVHRDFIAYFLNVFLMHAPTAKSAQHKNSICLGPTVQWIPLRLLSDSLLRSVNYLLTRHKVNNLPSLTKQMMALSLQPLLIKLCTSDPMAGAIGNHSSLLLVLCIEMMKKESNATILYDMTNKLLEIIEKDGADMNSRCLQSQSCLVLKELLVYDCQKLGVESLVVEMKRNRDRLLNIIFESIQSKRSNHFQNRLAQIFILAAKQPEFRSMLEEHQARLKQLAISLSTENPATNAQLTMLVPETYDFETLLNAIVEALMNISNLHLPTDLYITPCLTGDGPREVFVMDSAVPMRYVDQSQLNYRKPEVNACYEIIKRVVILDGRDQDVWELSRISRGTPDTTTTLYRTLPRNSNGSRFPPPVAMWQKLLPDGSAANVDADIMAQWRDGMDLSRRNIDFGNVENTSTDYPPLDDMDLLNSGNRLVRFENDEQISDSASDEAIAGSDHEEG